ncbi:hypothetical protein [Peptostreptococcus russellii]|uniref:hypothetical protein n=1 Tax=Peptostreptococcus russellii TaxID=215200 RepID=UPI003F58E908
MKLKKKKFLEDVRKKLISLNLPKDTIDQIISEIDVKYNFEIERGKSDEEIIEGFSGARKIAEKYASIFGYNKSHVHKFKDNMELSIFDIFKEIKKEELDKKEIKNGEENKRQKNKLIYKNSK